jgi:hypothetical protein
MWKTTRREFLRTATVGAVALGARGVGGAVQVPGGQRPPQVTGVEVLHPQGRVPLSLFIDDSTSLVNLAHYAMPQFAAVWPDRVDYQKDWRRWPREIPDSFVREFAEWCAGHGVKGKYSLVPYPACVGWLDRELPGWSRQELAASLKLVRDVLLPHWDIHPEMVSHTRMIDVKTGRPVPDVSPATMENWYPGAPKSADELAGYIACALRILKNCGFPCEGVTSPGGFGNGAESAYALAVRQAVADVCGAEVPHYLKYTSATEASCQPKVEYVEELETDHPRFVVNVRGATGDWFGGWTGDAEPDADRYANLDATSGRMVELIERGEPAMMLCHWPGLYSNGTKLGFEHCKQVILALNARFGDRTIWLKASELARYWAARELTRIELHEGRVTLTAPVAGPGFTLRVSSEARVRPQLCHNNVPLPLTEVRTRAALKPGTWLQEAGGVIVCFDLPRGAITLGLGAGTMP